MKHKGLVAFIAGVVVGYEGVKIGVHIFYWIVIVAILALHHWPV